MKGNSVLVGLAFLLAALSVMVTLFAYQYVQLTRSLNRSQFVISQVEVRQNRLKALINEAVEFSHQNPSIHPVLNAIGARLPATPASTPASR